MGGLGGWALALAGIVVLANLAQIAGQYLWLLIGDGSLATNQWLVRGTAVLFIGLMTYINHRGIRLGEHVQRVLTYVQYLALGGFALGLIIHIVANNSPHGQSFSFEWFNPVGAFADSGAVVHGVLLALFLYWGWDTCLALNEETENPSKTPGRGAIISTTLLVAIYLCVALLVMMYASAGSEGIGLANGANSADVFLAMKDAVLGPWGWLIVVAVLASVLSSTQTTILPTARGTLSMGIAKAIPAKFGSVNARCQTPGFSTVVMGLVAIAYYLLMSLFSQNLLSDSISAISLFIAFITHSLDMPVFGFSAAVFVNRVEISGYEAFFRYSGHWSLAQRSLSRPSRCGSPATETHKSLVSAGLLLPVSFCCCSGWCSLSSVASPLRLRATSPEPWQGLRTKSLLNSQPIR